MAEISPSIILEKDRRPKPPSRRSGWALLTDSKGKPPSLYGGKEVYLPTEISFRGLTEYMENEYWKRGRLPKSSSSKALEEVVGAAARSSLEEVGEIYVPESYKDPYMEVMKKVSQALALVDPRSYLDPKKTSQRTERRAKTLRGLPIIVSINALARGTGIIPTAPRRAAAALGMEETGLPKRTKVLTEALESSWTGRIEKDQSLKESSSFTSYPIRCEATERDWEVFRLFAEKGYDPALVLEAKMLEVQYRFLEKAVKVFEDCFKRETGKDIDYGHYKQKDIDKAMRLFYDLSKEEISGILGSSAYKKDDLLAVFKHNLENGGVEAINFHRDRYFGFTYKGFSFLIKYYDAQEKVCFPFEYILLDLERIRGMVDKRIAGLAKEGKLDDFIKIRQERDVLFQDLLAEGLAGRDALTIAGYLIQKGRVRPDDFKGMAYAQRLASDLIQWTKADAFFSVGGLNPGIHGSCILNSENNCGMGTASQLDISRPTSRREYFAGDIDNPHLAVTLTNVHKLTDAGPAKRRFRKWLDIAMEELNTIAENPEGTFLGKTRKEFLETYRVIKSASRELHLGLIDKDRKGCSFLKHFDFQPALPTEVFRQAELPLSAGSEASKKMSQYCQDLIDGELSLFLEQRKGEVDSLAEAGDWRAVLSLWEEQVEARINELVLRRTEQEFQREWEKYVAKRRRELIGWSEKRVNKVKIRLYNRIFRKYLTGNEEEINQKIEAEYQSEWKKYRAKHQEELASLSADEIDEIKKNLHFSICKRYASQIIPDSRVLINAYKKQIDQARKEFLALEQAAAHLEKEKRYADPEKQKDYEKKLAEIPKRIQLMLTGLQGPELGKIRMWQEKIEEWEENPQKIMMLLEKTGAGEMTKEAERVEKEIEEMLAYIYPDRRDLEQKMKTLWAAKSPDELISLIKREDFLGKLGWFGFSSLDKPIPPEGIAVQVKKLIEANFYYGVEDKTGVNNSIRKEYEKEGIGRVTTASLEVASDLAKLIYDGKYLPVSYVPVEVPGSPRLEIFYLSADKAFAYHFGCLLEDFNNYQEGNTSSIVSSFREFKNRLALLGGFKFVIKKNWARRLVTNIALVSAGAGKSREWLLNALTWITNPILHREYHPDSMVSFMKQKGKKGWLPIKSFWTARTRNWVGRLRHVVTGVIKNEPLEAMEYGFRYDPKADFLPEIERRLGYHFSEADKEEKKRIIKEVNREVDRDYNRSLLFKLLVYTVGSVDEVELQSMAVKWGKFSKEEKRKYKNNFINFLVWNKAQTSWNMEWDKVKQYDFSVLEARKIKGIIKSAAS